MTSISPPNILSRALDFSKQHIINPTISQINSLSVTHGSGKMIPYLPTIAQNNADTYQKVVEARNMLQAGSIRNDPRQNNQNYVYRGLVQMGPTRPISNPAIIPTSNVIPTSMPTRKITPAPSISNKPQNIPVKIPTATPTPVPNTNVVNTAINNPYYMDFKGYKVSAPGFEGKKIPQPPQNVAKLLHTVFGSSGEATPSAAVAWAENGNYNQNAISAVNNNGTRDYGIMQVNSGTFDGLRTSPYWKEKMAELGINEKTPYTVLLNPEINIKVAQLVHQREVMGGGQPWYQWYGWQQPPLGKGVNLQEMLQAAKKKVLVRRKK